jgi:hypothetical protein
MANQTETITLSYQNGSCSFAPDNGNVTVHKGDTMTVTFNPGAGVQSIDGAAFFTDAAKTQSATGFTVQTDTPAAGRVKASQTDNVTAETIYYYSLSFTDSGGTSRVADPQWKDEPT